MSAAPSIAATLPLPPIYYDHRRQVYWCTDAHSEWIMHNETSVKRILKSLGFLAATNSIPLSDLDRGVMNIQSTQNVSYAGPLAGYAKGLARINGSNPSTTIIIPQWRQL